MLLQTGAAYVSTERINSLYRVILLGMDNVESRARRGKSWRKMPVALCDTEVKCLVNRRSFQVVELQFCRLIESFPCINFDSCFKSVALSTGPTTLRSFTPFTPEDENVQVLIYCVVRYTQGDGRRPEQQSSLLHHKVFRIFFMSHIRRVLRDLSIFLLPIITLTI